ncbi:terpene synthase family protein [Nannocystis punicea]|uniref:Terpene synthase n=1 Tax=Nannocystis punicea TaxID=2995304 RepID=A0ABY7HI63_9BACT|nr:terpene synthase family protein [Nannocystis poenicansa]WAS99026.1 terpene synthase family protein [Nannocystis poenicansa]
MTRRFGTSPLSVRLAAVATTSATNRTGPRGRALVAVSGQQAGVAAAAHAVDADPLASSSEPRQRLMQLPTLECPYHPSVHPAADEIHESTVAWAQAMGFARSQEHIDALRDSRIGHLLARIFPATADMVALQVAVDWTTLFCCLDDRLEQMNGAAQVASYLRSLLGVFRDGAHPQLIDPFAQAFGDLRERMLELRVPNWIPRFSACVERLFNAFVDEAKYRAAGVVPAFASHSKIRQITVGLYTGFLLGELTEHIFLPPDVLEHEAVQALEVSASTIVGLANDIYTVEKEIAKGEVNNTVLVLMHEDGLAFDEAIGRTVQLHNIEMREFSRLVSDLPSFDEDTDDQLRRYVQVLIHFISGHDDWARSTGRYHHPGDDSAVR